jgi:hypothetical protein
VLAVALTVSGFGYLLLNPALAWAAYLSLPMLLIWVAGAGVLSARVMSSPARAGSASGRAGQPVAGR